jgi:two-component system sensor histidine kinase KdpD
MGDQQRPTPEKLLRQIERETRGKLTIFLGPAAGVGKTYAMLEAAQERLAEGVDVIIGWVETHGRRETEALLEGLPLLPPMEIEYKGRSFREMDLNALLEHHPEIALVDELAHSNIPGSLHDRRFQDVEELLKAGIDVYTTLNIQHIESLNDVVTQITEIPVRETVPDRLLDDADQIRLIDISPDELIKRLEDGKVYVPEKARHAITRFFRPGNINALRELALRFTAQGVDRQLDRYREAHAIERPWRARELVMAAVSPSPFSSQVIRAARRLASGLKTEWIATFVEDPSRGDMSASERDQLSRNLRLAEELGAEVVALTGTDMALELLKLSRKRNVTAIVIGKPLKPRLRTFRRPTIVEKVMQGSQGISVHVIPGTTPQKTDGKRRALNINLEGFDASPLLAIVLVVAAQTLLMRGLRPIMPELFDVVNVALLYLLPVLFSAVRWGRWPSILAALTATLCFDVFFVPPELSIKVADLRYLLVFLIFLIVAFITGTLASRLRNQARIAGRREERASALYTLSRQIASETDIQSILKISTKAIASSIEGDVAIYMSDTSGGLTPQAATAGADRLMESRERAVAQWVFESGEIAGKGTETLSAAMGLFLPLVAEQKKIGVLGVLPNVPEKHLSPRQRRLLESFAGFISLAIAREQMRIEAQQAHYAAESERLRTALFNSVSHDLRTPLASITGAVTSLQEEDVYNSDERRALIAAIKDSALQLNHLVGNLLDTARLESGMLQLRKDWCDIQDLIGVALRRSRQVVGDREFRIKMPEEVPLIKADFSLIEQVLVNLLYNAAQYSPPDSEISITVNREDGEIRVTVGDSGPGIAPEDRERVFDKFYRLYAPEHVSGTGLGLSICKAFIEAHGGRIWVEPNPEGGSLFIFSLPLETQPVVREPEQGENNAE